ncbi:hypothetical protein OKJ48_25825 [Streptomyces kunmingensis]|uniref:Integral membrane protein n=1 Tax=Streptomyces kunmingensis TaxID=68225 RepID=A0ABU6CFZ8_9ACTN|nr:hypothetical protein [Streptomyces kunmingensis]MEB3963633.1 hypothetical protein [Streptomyces kunmingensis]
MFSAASAVSAVSVTRQVAAAALAALLLTAGVWASWGAAQHVTFPTGRERGTMTVTRCTHDTCTGPFAPGSPTAVRHASVTIDRSIGETKGASFPVVLKPSSTSAVRAGTAGFLHAWVPLGGALLLASVVIAGGMRNRRLTWITGGAGFALLTATFVAVSF